MTDRAFALHMARVMLNEARARRHSRVNRDFYWSLIAWAQRSRRQAMAALREPMQHDLFGAAA